VWRISQSRVTPLNTQGQTMRFLLTMNMPSYGGALVHQIQAEYPVDNLSEFVDVLTNNDFVIVEEYYKDQQTKESYSRGNVAINYKYVGKIKVLNQQERD
jgi:hypothetical protein